MKKTVIFTLAAALLLAAACSAKGSYEAGMMDDSRAAPAAQYASSSQAALSGRWVGTGFNGPANEELPSAEEQYGAPQFTTAQRKLVKRADLRIRNNKLNF